MSSVSAISSSSRLDGLPLGAPPEPAVGQPRLAPDRVTLSGEARQRLGGGSSALTQEQQQQVQQLRQRDAQVRQHEAAHQAAGGQLTGGASFSYQTGPDGKSYATGGEVQVSAHAGRTPDETIAIARQVRAAALAPADPSSADLSAASSAAQMEAQAQQQKRAQEAERTSAAGGSVDPATAGPSQKGGGAAKAVTPAGTSAASFSLEQLVARRRAST